ncbi:MAG: hypothetical protein ABIH66_10030 [bacterium]
MVAKKQARLSISITEELEEKLGMFRDKINISEICRNALSDVVDTLLRGRAEVQEKKEETIARLRKERENSDYDDYIEGLSDGYSHASRLSFRELLQYAKEISIQSILGRHPYSENLFAQGNVLEDEGVQNLLDFFPSWLEDEVAAAYYGTEGVTELSMRPLFNLMAYASGWSKGVYDFWFEIKDEVVFTKDSSEGETEDVLENRGEINDGDKKAEKQEKIKGKGGKVNAKSKRKDNKN